MVGRAVRVMSYNIRVEGNKDPDVHKWGVRRPSVLKVIRSFNADFIGVQESTGKQRSHIRDAIGRAEYGVISHGRLAGDVGEKNPLFWRKDRFKKLDEGHFWLSESPDRAGTIGWPCCPRPAQPFHVSWGIFGENELPAERPIFVANVHFANGKDFPVARLHSAHLLDKRVRSIGKGCRRIVMGDFNEEVSSIPHMILFGQRHLRDTFGEVHPNSKAATKVKNWNPETRNGRRIDWIGVSKSWKLLDAGIERGERAGGYTPSDHFAATAVIERD